MSSAAATRIGGCAVRSASDSSPRGSSASTLAPSSSEALSEPRSPAANIAVNPSRWASSLARSVSDTSSAAASRSPRMSAASSCRAAAASSATASSYSCCSPSRCPPPRISSPPTVTAAAAPALPCLRLAGRGASREGGGPIGLLLELNKPDRLMTSEESSLGGVLWLIRMTEFCSPCYIGSTTVPARGVCRNDVSIRGFVVVPGGCCMEPAPRDAAAGMPRPANRGGWRDGQKTAIICCQSAPPPSHYASTL